MIDAIMLSQSTDHWISVLEAAGVPCSPVNNLAQMLAHPQTEAMGVVQPVPGTEMKFIGLPLSFDGIKPSPYGAPPKLGEHTNLIIQSPQGQDA